MCQSQDNDGLTHTQGLKRLHRFTLEYCEMATKRHVEAPEEFFCPISSQIMDNPVIAEDGFSYEKDFIVDWLQKSGTSPFTREKMSIHKLITNRSLKSMIDSFLHQNPQFDEEKYRGAEIARLKELLANPKKEELTIFLVKNSAIFTQSMYLSDTLIHHSCKASTNIVVLESVLSAIKMLHLQAKPLFSQINSIGLTPELMLAAQLGLSDGDPTRMLPVAIRAINERAIKYLVTQCNLNPIVGSFQLLPLMMAIGKNHPGIVRELIANNANVNTCISGISIISETFNKFPGHTGVIEILLHQKATTKAGEVPLIHKAIEKNSVALVDLLGRFKYPLIELHNVGGTIHSPLSVAVLRNYESIVVALLKFNVLDTVLPRSDVSALGIAISQLNINIIKHLAVYKRLDKSFKDSKGLSYLHMAVSSGKGEIAKILLDNNFPCSMFDNKGVTPKGLAKQLKLFDIYQMIREHQVADAIKSQSEQHFANFQHDLQRMEKIIHTQASTIDRYQSQFNRMQDSINNLTNQVNKLSSELKVVNHENITLKNVTIPSLTNTLNQKLNSLSTSNTSTTSKLARDIESLTTKVRNVELSPSKPQAPARVQVPAIEISVPSLESSHRDKSGALTPRCQKLFSGYRSCTYAVFKSNLQDAPYAAKMIVGQAKDTLLIKLTSFYAEKPVNQCLSADEVKKVKLLLSYGASWYYANSRGESADTYFDRSDFS